MKKSVENSKNIATVLRGGIAELNEEELEDLQKDGLSAKYHLTELKDGYAMNSSIAKWFAGKLVHIKNSNFMNSKYYERKTYGIKN